MRVIKALGALVALVGVVVGPPWVLLRFIGNPWPTEGIVWDAPLTDGAVMGVLAVIVWILWAQLMICIISEAVSVLSGDRVQMTAPLTLGIQQHLARKLVAAVVLAGVATGTGASAAMADTPATAATPTTTTMGVEHTSQQKAATQTGPTQSVTVMRLDSLWSIAERHLGDGDRWTEIAALNEGTIMNDGSTFGAAELIQPGWKLLIPAGGAHTNRAEMRVVQAGDTLSQIALEELGDANAYPALFNATAHSVQPDGHRLQDPDLIQPGWTITIPARGRAAAAPQEEAGPTTPPSTEPIAPQVEPKPEHAAPKQTAEPTATTATRAQADRTPSGSATTPRDAAELSDDGPWPARTVGGVCSLLASALVGLVIVRRTRQRRQRKPGQQTPLPAGAAAEVEEELRQVAEPLSVKSIDVALRHLVTTVDRGELPSLRLVRLVGEQLDLYFDDETALPEPWEATSEPDVWVLSAVAAASISPSDSPAPWPALVTLGHDEDGGLILINLDHEGTFGAIGESATAWVTAAALELGSATWADGQSMAVTGGLEDLERVLEPGRVRYVPSAGAVPDGTQVVVDVGEGMSRDEHDVLRARGITVVTSGWFAGIHAIEVTSSERARLLPYELEITPQVVDERTYSGLVDVLATSLQTPRERGAANQVVPFVSDPPDADPHQDRWAAEAHIGGGFDVFDQVDEPDGGKLTGDIPSAIEEISSKSEDTAGATVGEPIVTAESGGGGAQDVPPPPTIGTPAAEDDLHPLLATGHPVIRLLGPVAELAGASGRHPGTHAGVCTRIAVWMILNPKATRPALMKSVWGGQRVKPTTVNPRISNLRYWLADHPQTAEKYLPAGSLRLSDAIATDWAVFTGLVGERPQRASTEALEQALSLVQGRPLEGEDPKYYAFAEYFVTEVMDLIVDVAYELARRRYFEGQWLQAGRAAARGLMIEEGNERLWRMRIHAAHSAGNTTDVDEAIGRVRERITKRGIDLDQETTELLDALEAHDDAAIELCRAAL